MYNQNKTIMKKLFTLLAVACSLQHAAAADEVIASFTFPDNTAITATASNVEGTKCTVSYAKIGGKVENTKSLGSQVYQKFTNATSAWLKIKLNTGSFQAGDKFHATMFCAGNKTDGFFFKSTEGNSQTVEMNTTAEVTLEYVLTDDDIDDDGSLTVYRNNSNCYARHFEVLRAEGTTKQTPTTTFAKSTVGFKMSGSAVNQAASTNSDGAVSYLSNNTAVVTVDAATGALTAVAPGKATITAKTAATATYAASSASYYVYVLSEATGTLTDPYLPTDFRYMVETYEGESEGAAEGWVAGYAIGVFNSGDNDVRIFTPTTTSTTTEGTIGLGNTADEAVGNNCLAIQLLSESNVRANLNLKDNWDAVKGKKVWVHGKACLFTQSSGTVIIYGMSGTDDYSLDGVTPTGIAQLKADLPTAADTYNLAGQRVEQPKKGLYIQNGKKVIIK